MVTIEVSKCVVECGLATIVHACLGHRYGMEKAMAEPERSRHRAMHRVQAQEERGVGLGQGQEQGVGQHVLQEEPPSELQDRQRLADPPSELQGFQRLATPPSEH